MRSNAAPPSEERDRIEALLAERLRGPHELIGFQQRPASRLYRYRSLRSTDATRLIVKVSLLRPPGARGSRPRLMEPTPQHRKAMLEFNALRDVERHFVAMSDPRFGAIRAIDVFEPLHALVMHEADGRSLRHMLRGALLPGLGRDAARTEAAMQRAGAWLRAYHRIAAPDGVESRLASPDAVAELAMALGEYLRDAVPDGAAFAIGSATANAARDLLAGELPLAVVHGDFAMRNVLVGDDQRVTVLDMLRRWRAPAHEDVVTMLNALESVGLGLRLAGLLPPPPAVRRSQAAFLGGYFGGEHTPRAALAVLGALQMLDRAAALHERRDGRSELLRRGMLRIARRHLADLA